MRCYSYKCMHIINQFLKFFAKLFLLILDLNFMKYVFYNNCVNQRRLFVCTDWFFFAKCWSPRCWLKITDWNHLHLVKNKLWPLAFSISSHCSIELLMFPASAVKKFWARIPGLISLTKLSATDFCKIFLPSTFM